MARKRFHQSKKDRRHESKGMHGAMYLKEHDEKRGPHGEFEAIGHHGHPAKHHAHHSKQYHHADGGHPHHSSSIESHHGDTMDPRHFSPHRRGEEPHMAQHEYRERGVRGEYYAGAEPRRRQEMEDAGMIHEDHRAIANLPQNVMIKPYPMTGPYNPEILDDTIAGIDRQMDYDDHKREDNFYPKKV